MRNAQSRLRNHVRTVEQEIDVDGSRRLGRAARPNAPLSILDAQAGLQECARGKIGFQAHDGVEVLGLVDAALGESFVKSAGCGHAA